MSRPRKTCQYVPGKCPRGETCMFYHAEPQPALGLNPDDGTRPTAASTPVIKAPSGQTICKYFLSGSCRFGDKCRNLHSRNTDSSMRQCKFSLEGTCKYGEHCRFNHEMIKPDTESQNIVTETSLRLKLGKRRDVFVGNSGTIERNMVGPTRAKFGSGAEVLEVITILETRRIFIENLHQSSTEDSVKAALERRFGKVEEISIAENEGHVTALVTMSTPQSADAAIGFIKHYVPEGLTEAPLKHLISYRIPESRLQNGPNLSTTIEVTCHYPSRLAWAHFKDGKLAQRVANQVNGSKLWGRRLVGKYERPSYSRGRNPVHSVSISNLPFDITEEVLKRRFQSFSDLQMEPPKYSAQQFEREMRRELEKHGDLVSFEVSPIREGNSKLYAFARFSKVQETLLAVAKLHSKKMTFLGESPVYLEIINSIKYAIRSEIWPVVGSEVRKSLDFANAGKSRGSSIVHFALYENPDVHPHVQKFRLYSKDIKALGSRKVDIDRILRGETVLSGGVPVWSHEFETAEGRIHLRSLSIPDKCIISGDSRLRTLTMYGEPVARDEVRTKILNYLESLRSDNHTLSIDRQQLAWLLSGGFPALQIQHGAQNIQLDVIRRTLKVIGSDSTIDDVRQSLLLATNSIADRTSSTSEDCPICYCDLDNPLTLNCGHSYCKECFKHCLDSTISNRLLPLRCVTCDSGIELRVLSQSPRFNELLDASFAVLISSNPNLYAYCPTPDCPQVYRVGPAGTVFQCSECLSNVCTFCKMEWHEGMSCAEIQEYQDPETRRNVGLMKELGIKHCPKCRTLIEKTMGCNHMTCRGCNTHICWICMKDFGEGGGPAVYDHMTIAHGGWGL